MKYWITTDTHFSHHKLVEYGYRESGFEDKIMSRHMLTVSEQDIVIHLGDFAFYKEEYWHKRFLSEVPGKKWLIKGNHDRRTDSWYLNIGWDYVSDFLLMKKFGYLILFTHKPVYEGEYIMIPGIDKNCHGHIHRVDENNRYGYLDKRTDRNILVSLEDNNYYPVDLRKLLNK